MMRWCRYLLLGLLVSTSLVFAAGNKVGPKKCTISWQASVETSTAPVSGYRIYLRKQGQSYSTVPWVSVPKTQTQVTCPVLGTDGQYYIVARAWNPVGESPNSNEAPFVYDSVAPAPIF